MRKPIFPCFLEVYCKVAQYFKNSPVITFYKAIRSRMVCYDGCFLFVELCANVLKNLIFKLCPVVTQESRRSRVRTNEMRYEGISHCRSRLVRQGSQDCETAKMIDTKKNIGRALDAVWQLHEVDTYVQRRRVRLAMDTLR